MAAPASHGALPPVAGSGSIAYRYTVTAAYIFRFFRYSFLEEAPRHRFQPLAPGMDAIALCLAMAALALGLLAHFPLELLHGDNA